MGSSDEPGFLRLWMADQYAVSAWLLARGVPRQDADDLLQDIAIAAHQAFDRYEASRPFVAWVLGIARNKVADHWRRQTDRQWSLFDREAQEQIDLATERLAAACSDRHWAMQRCVGKLGDGPRDLVQRHYWSGQPLAQIARACSLSVANVKVRLHRIRQSLRRCVERFLKEGADS